MLDRNVAGFMRARDQLKALHFQSRKGLLFYGPPGTGKTYTIHYLASQLADHTALLNKLLNEMDGLREDADVLFILTTNRPDQIEPALVSRPGRIDQAIEFPLPDEEGRAKLAKLYARSLSVPEELMELIVSRTKGVSAAFIKELMRRCAQFQIELSCGHLLTQRSVDAAIQEMLFTGGSLNRRLLGGEGADAPRLSAGPSHRSAAIQNALKFRRVVWADLGYAIAIGVLGPIAIFQFLT